MKKSIAYLLTITAVLFLVMFPGCGKDNSINIFSIQDDIALGQQADEQIRANPQAFPILDSAQ
jgi:hypothetical protein